MLQSYEDDRDPLNRRFILIKELVKGKTLSEQVQDISQVDLACMIKNFTLALSSFGEYEPLGDAEFSEKNLLFKGQEGIQICDYLKVKLSFS